MPRDEQRLRELEEQKRRLEQVLAWLELEIAAARREAESESGQTPAPPARARERQTPREAAPPDVGAPRAASPGEAAPSERPAADPESLSQPEMVADLYGELGPDTQSARQSVRRGCLLYAALAFAALAALIAYAIWWY